MTLTKDKATGVLQISGTLDIDGADSLREALLDCSLHQSAAADLSADLSDVDGCDAAALQVLLAARRDAVAAGKAFRITAASNAVTDTAAALGLPIDEPRGVLGKERSNAS